MIKEVPQHLFEILYLAVWDVPLHTSLTLNILARPFPRILC